MYLDPADSNKKIHPRKLGTTAQPPRQAQTDWQMLLEKSGYVVRNWMGRVRSFNGVSIVKNGKW